MALDQDLAVRLDRRGETFSSLHAADQEGGPAIDETLVEAVVQGIRQPVFDGAGALSPVPGVGQPVARKAT